MKPHKIQTPPLSSSSRWPPSSASMGCSVSKLEPGEEAPPGLRPVQRKIEEIRRNRRRRTAGRKDSIVSTTELLISPEDVDDVVSRGDDSLHGPVNAAATDDEKEVTVKDEKRVEDKEEKKNKKKKEEEKKDEEKKENAVEQQKQKHEVNDDEKSKDNNNDEVKETKKEEKGGDAGGPLVGDENRRINLIPYDEDEEEELVGSPSFRIYFVDDSNKVEDQAKEENGFISGKDSFRRKDDSSNEGSEARAAKKARGRRLRALATKPITYGLRSCYHHGNSVAQGERSPLSGSKTTVAAAQ